MLRHRVLLPACEAGRLGHLIFVDAQDHGLTVKWDEINALQQRLYPEESVFVEGAVDKRRREFTAGRVLARRLQAQLGVVSGPLLRGKDRAPIWPEAVCGSISHTDEMCAVAVGPRDRIHSVGLDIESIGRVTPELWRQLFTDREVATLNAMSGEERTIAATGMFSAKESFFKLQYSLTQQWVSFKEADVDLLDNQNFIISTRKELQGIPESLPGFMCRPTADVIATLLFLAA